MKYTAYFLSLAFIIYVFSQCFALELTDLSIEYNDAIGTNRNRLLPKNSIKRGELNLNMAVRTSELTYTELQIQSSIDQSQFRTIGLEVESGLRYKQVELYVQHHSQHVLDTVGAEKYPNENSVGVRVKLCCLK